MDNRSGGGHGHDEAVDDEIVGFGRESPPSSGGGARRRLSKARLRARLLIAGVAVTLIAALVLYLRGGRYEGTDNAAVQAGQVAIAANVGGQVVAIAVHENQVVRAGQLLFRIDPRPYRAAVDEAAAQLAQARAGIASRRADLGQNRAGIAAARARLAYAENEARRQKALFAEGISSRNQYDQAVLAVATERQAVATAEQQAEGVRAALSGDPALPVDRQPAVRAAQAALDRARLNLAYADVRAPQDGVVTKVDGLQVGDYVAPARQVFSLVGQRVWIDANFKESQLAHMLVGQRAEVRIDAYPGRRLAARVASFSPGTGSSFALLPAENATGNWVKVVQRLPVRLELERVPADMALHAGLSAEVTVDTRRVRHLFGADTEAPAAPR